MIFLAPLNTWLAKVIDCSRKSAGSNTASTTPISKASGDLSMVLLFSALTIITRVANSGPINFGNKVAPPQPGTKPRNTSGKPIIAVVARVRYWQCNPISSPPPRANPLIKAKVGFPHSPKRRKTSCPNLVNACARVWSATPATPLRSAPAAKINGFPVIPIASASEAIATSSAALRDCKPCTPIVLGRLWS